MKVPVNSLHRALYLNSLFKYIYLYPTRSSAGKNEAAVTLWLYKEKEYKKRADYVFAALSLYGIIHTHTHRAALQSIIQGTYKTESTEEKRSSPPLPMQIVIDLQVYNTSCAAPREGGEKSSEKEGALYIYMHTIERRLTGRAQRRVAASS